MGAMCRMWVGLGLGAALVGCAGSENPATNKKVASAAATKTATAATTAKTETATAATRSTVGMPGGGPQGMGGGGSAAGGQPNMAGMQGQGGQGQSGSGGTGGNDMPNFGSMRGGQGQGQGQGQQGGAEAGAGGSDMPNFGVMRGGQGQGQGQQGGGGAGGSDKPDFGSMRGGQGQGQGSSSGAAGGSPFDQGGRKGSKKEKKKEEESKPEDAVNLFLDGLAAADKKDLAEAISSSADSQVLRRLRAGKWGEKELASLKERYADNTILVLEVKTTPNEGERWVAIGVPSNGGKPTKTVGEVLVRREVPRVWRVISVVKATGS